MRPIALKDIFPVSDYLLCPVYLYHSEKPKDFIFLNVVRQ